MTRENEFLIAQASQGDERAIGTLVEPYLPALRTRLTRLLTRLGVLPPPEDDGEEPPLPFDFPALGACYAASLEGRTALGDDPDRPRSSMMS